MWRLARGLRGTFGAMTVRPDARYSASSLRKRARWFLRAGPSDYMLAMSVASASLPVIGKHLEPLGAATAMGIWGYKHVPDFFVNVAHARRITSEQAEIRKQERDVDQRRSRGRAARRRARSRPCDRLARAGAAAAGAEAFGSTVAACIGPRFATATTRRSCWTCGAEGPARRAGAGDDLRAGRRVDPRRPASAGLRADVAPGRAGLGVPVHRLPGARRIIAGRNTSPTSRPRSHGRAPTSTGSAVTAISLRSLVVRPAATSRRWPA